MAIDKLLKLVEDGGFCNERCLFSWNVSGFCEATRYFKMHNDRSRLDLTPQDLGVLESSRPTAAMAPHQQWLSQGMVRWEEKFRKFLGSSGNGWPDAMVAENQGGQFTVESERFDRRVRKIQDVYCRNTPKKISCWSWKTIDPGNIETGSSQWRWLSLSYVSFFLHDVSLPLVHWLNMKKHVHPTNSRKESSMFDSDHKSCWSTNSPDLKAAE